MLSGKHLEGTCISREHKPPDWRARSFNFIYSSECDHCKRITILITEIKQLGERAVKSDQKTIYYLRVTKEIMDLDVIGWIRIRQRWRKINYLTFTPY